MSSQNRRNEQASWGVVIGQLGRGSSGVVELVEIEGRLFVVKKVLDESSQHILNASELKILSQIQHPHIVKLKNWRRKGKQLQLLFQYDGQIDLQKIITKRAQQSCYFTQSIIWIFLHQSLLALEYLHSSNILHRDIKPSNLFINTKNINLKIGDFGSAKKNNGENYTRVGTPLYLSPEIISYEAYSEKTDIWSLGVSIFHAAALRPPFQFKNFLKLAQSISYCQPTFPQHLSQKLKEIIQKMMKKDPHKRPNAGQLIDEYFEGQRLCHINQNIHLSFDEKSQKHQDMNLFEEEKEKQSKNRIENVFRAPQINHSQIRQSVWSNIDEGIQQIYQLENFDEGKSMKIPGVEQICQTTINLEVNFNDFSHFNGFYTPSRRNSNLQQAILYNCRKSSLYHHQEYNPHASPFKPIKQQQNKQNTSHARQSSQISYKSKHTKLMANLKQKSGNENRSKLLNTLHNKPQYVIIDSKPLLPYLNDTFFQEF